MLARYKAAIRDEEPQWVNVRRQLPGILLLVTLLATASCSDCDCPDTSAPMATPETQAAPPPESETSRMGVFVIPDTDELVIPTVSEDEMETSMRHLHHVEPWVTVEGPSIIYSGGTYGEGYDVLMRLAEQSNTSELVISSPGGEAYWGIKIGELVYENGWDVRVRGLCMSSCANYIFPAGRNKVIEDGGVVGWHGSHQQYHFFAEQKGISVRQAIVNSFSLVLQHGFGGQTQEEFNEVIARTVAETETRIELELAYYERIGVDADVPVYGHFPQRLEGIQGSGGWTFTLDDMAKFGLDDIIYEGSEAYPSDRARALFSLVLIEVDDR